MHEAYEPNAIIDFLDTEPLTGEHGRDVDLLSMHASRAHEIGQLIRVRCINCNITRHYLPGDLAKLMGDIPFWDVERHMRCERCKRRDLDVDILLPSALEAMKMRVRRLIEIRMVRRVIWRDDEF